MAYSENLVVLEDAEIYPDALQQILPVPLHSLGSAIVRVDRQAQVDEDAVSIIYTGWLELPGRLLLPVSIQPYIERRGTAEPKLLAREMEIWSTLNHPRVLPMLGHGTLESTTAIVTMQNRAMNIWSYLEGRPEADKHRLIVQVAEGLDYLHNERRIVHGDLKTASVCVDHHGNVVISGFKLSTSIVKSPLAEPTMTEIRQLHTLRYAAPELIVDECCDVFGKRSKTTESDIFSFGIMVYEIQFGLRAWPSSSDLKVVVNVVNGQRPPRPEESCSQMNESMWNLCVACWDQDPAKRPRIADILVGLRSPQLPMHWQAGGLDTAGEHVDSAAAAPLERPRNDEIPGSTLRIVLGAANVDIVLPTQIPMRGGFGKVLKGRAWIRGGERSVAVKICQADKVGPHENSIWSSLLHKNLLPLYGATELPLSGEFVFVSPYMTGGNAVEYLEHNPRVNRLPLMMDVTSGLEHLHNKAKIIHGDIKAENVLIADDGRAVLSDFGLSTTVAPGPQTSGSHARGMFTWAYAAPEIIDGTADDPNFPGRLRSKTKRSDMYAYGVLLYHVYAGGFKMSMGDRLRLIGAMHEGRWPERPIGLPQVLCDDLWSICTRCWGKKPTGRPSVARVLRELKELESSPERQAIETPAPDAPQHV